MIANSQFEYVGKELRLFEKANNWKTYWSRRIAPYLGRSVIEVGAGLGINTELLCSRRQELWLSIEPDPHLAAELTARLAAKRLPQCCRVFGGVLADIPPSLRVDTILYVDVLEHIERDREEVVLAAAHLSPGGFLVVLSPAHGSLYSPFDKAIGHYRRYDRRSYTQLTSPGLKLVRIEYLDSIGMMASAMNKYLLRSGMPTQGQIQFWDSLLVPASRIADVLLRHRVGKSILGVWTRE